MQPVEFPQQTDVLAKDQPQYIPLPVHVKYEQHEDENGRPVNVPMEMTFCCELSPEEIAEANATSKIWFTQCVFGNQFQPVRLSTQNPFEEAPQLKISPIRALVKAFADDPDYRQTWKANIAEAFKIAWDSWEFHKFPQGIVTGKELVPSIHELANKAADNFLNALIS